MPAPLLGLSGERESAPASATAACSITHGVSFGGTDTLGIARRTDASGVYGSVAISAGIARDPQSTAIHAVNRMAGSFTRTTRSKKAPLRITPAERMAHSARNSAALMASSPFVRRFFPPDGAV